MKRIVGALFLLSVLVRPAPVAASEDGLDVRQWLNSPGVKLLAVEFYATWCKPCMAAVPRWKALHEKYRSAGLRLVVIATQDPQGGCVNPGWNPDDVVCDDDGRLAERFGASRLPSAYLWTWEGDLLVRQQHVDEVEAKIETWLKRTRRIDVQVVKIGHGAKITETALADLVRARLRDEDKLTIIASDAERKRLDEVRKKSLEARYDDRLQCEVGMELSANSVLGIQVTMGGRPRLQFQITSAEFGCSVTHVAVDWNKNKPAVSVAEGVAKLMGRLRRPPTMPWMRDNNGQPKVAVSPYERMARELAAAKAHAARLEESWKVVKTFAASRSIAVPRREKALRDFLADFAINNPHETEARQLLASLTPPPVKRAPPPVRRAPPPPPPSHGGELIAREKLHFETGKAVLKAISMKTIDELARTVNARSDARLVEVSAHTDSRGSSRYNKRLSELRAAEVVKALVGKGVDRARLRAVGYGEEKPIADNGTSVGREQNRRVEFRIIDPR